MVQEYFNCAMVNLLGKDTCQFDSIPPSSIDPKDNAHVKVLKGKLVDLTHFSSPTKSAWIVNEYLLIVFGAPSPPLD